ncbi:MAG: carbohydrate binding family 9 domain-containing protein [Gemmatimonadetes bacterium]|nr:carbohydrate binding family 9 domain-containing protein [Gemmatimonadota bacterium]
MGTEDWVRGLPVRFASSLVAFAMAAFVLVASVLLAAPEVRAQSREAAGSAGGGGSGGGEEGAVMMVPRLSFPIDFDGRVDDDAWASVEPLPLVQYWPDPGDPMSVGSDIRVGYDADYFYAAGRFQDEPGGVRANSFGRDQWDGDDAFDIIIDSFNDNETALKFTVLPLGALVDEEVQNDATSTGDQWPVNRDWNGFWEARTHRTEDGWSAEMRIPWSSLGFKADDGRVVMGLIAGRYIARLDERHVFPVTLHPDISNAEIKPSLAQDVEIRGVESGPPLYVSPYVLSGVDRTRDVDLGLPPTSEVPREVGLDVKLGLTNNLTLDLTANTDFAQVESDALQVNLDRFNLFFPEKRQFFQERASTFQFQLGDGSRLFHSRRIGLGDDGSPRRILGGARLVGRAGEWDVGVLSMQVDGSALDGGENDGVVRVRRSVLDGLSSIGGMVTSKVTGAGTDFSMGVDTELHLGGDHFLIVQGAQSRNAREEAFGPDVAFGERSLGRIRLERRRGSGTGFETEVEYSGRAFDPRLGFEERGNHTAFKARAFRSWNPEDSWAVRNRVYLNGRAWVDNETGSVSTALGRVRWEAIMNGGHYWNTAVNFTWERLDETLELPGGTVAPGEYGGLNLFSYLWLNRAMPLSGEGNVWVGQFMDGWRFNVWAAPTWVVSPHLALTGGYRVHRLWFPDRDQRVDADEATFRVSGALNASFSAEAFFQYSMAADRMAANVRLRYRFAEGRDLYLVVDEVRDVASHLDPELVPLGRSDRRLLLKYGHTFRW